MDLKNQKVQAGSALTAIIFLLIILALACVSPPQHVYHPKYEPPVKTNDTRLIQGKYSASDMLDGAVTIKSIEINGKGMNINFSNFTNLYLDIKQGGDSFLMKGTKTCMVQYRGHAWHTPFSVTVNDICLDSSSNPFYVKFSASINILDCEKQVLNFNCSELKVWNYWDPGRTKFGQPITITK